MFGKKSPSAKEVRMEKPDVTPKVSEDVELGSARGEADAPEETTTEPVAAADEEEEGKEYPSVAKVIPVMFALYLTLFLISLVSLTSSVFYVKSPNEETDEWQDRTIITTAIPQITDDFHSIGDIGWYASAYMITGCAFQLIYGRIYTFYSPKWIFLSSIGLFELGSLVCAVAPNSPAFIVGRAIAGLGSAGIFSGGIVVMVHIIPLRKRPIYQGFMGAVFLISSVIGPLLGGAFTTNVTWRWCFYINLPIGGVTILLILFFLKLPDMKKKDEAPLSLRQKIDRLDPIGTACFLPGIVCLLLALQWGGSTYAWGSWRVVLLFILSGLLAIAFVVVQIWKQENATLPPRILKYRSVTSTTFFAFCTSGSMTTIIVFLPTWFQAIQGVDAVESGIRMLPLILALVVSSIMAGGFTNGFGYYTPTLIACSVLMSVGAGLLSTFSISTNHAHWIGYQVLFGYGVGLGQQQAGLAAQVVLPPKDVATGVSLKFFGQQLGGAIFISVSQSVLSNKLASSLSYLPNLDPAQVVNLGATELRHYVSPDLLPAVLVAYNHALDSVFRVALVLACISLLGALLTEWKSVKGKNLKGA
ncbi:MAG: hypothetical protein M1818_001645 [Claussenomyces sp. TS43310]|nr:MAG: hypothetical protein M1818_001645 [Claussenomyces sp. TS43310]